MHRLIAFTLSYVLSVYTTRKVTYAQGQLGLGASDRSDAGDQ